MAAEEPGDVLQEDSGRVVALDQSEEGEREAAPFPREALALACDAEILAREAA
jgi:hypothetical protein